MRAERRLKEVKGGGVQMDLGLEAGAQIEAPDRPMQVGRQQGTTYGRQLVSNADSEAAVVVLGARVRRRSGSIGDAGRVHLARSAGGSCLEIGVQKHQ